MARPARLTVPAATASLEPVRRFVEAYARAAGFDEAAVLQVVMSVDEAAANIVKHAYRGDAAREFTVVLSATARQLVVRLQHSGAAFDPSRYQSPGPLGEAAAQRRKGGLGVHLMHRLMDEVSFEARPGHAEVRMAKRRA